MVGKPTDDNKVQLEVESPTYYKGTLNADDSYTYSNEAETTSVASFLNRYNTFLPEDTTFTLSGYKSLLNRPANDGDTHGLPRPDGNCPGGNCPGGNRHARVGHPAHGGQLPAGAADWAGNRQLRCAGHPVHGEETPQISHSLQFSHHPF